MMLLRALLPWLFKLIPYVLLKRFSCKLIYVCNEKRSIQMYEYNVQGREERDTFFERLIDSKQETEWQLLF